MLLSFIGTFLENFIYLFLGISGNCSFPPVLTPEEERKYFTRYKNGDEKARQVLIEHNLRLVAHIIKKYYTGHKDQEDLISIGTIGLIKAIDSYNIENGTRFATYAGKCLQNEILMYFRSQKKLSQETSINDSIEFDKDGNALTYIDIISVDDNIIDEIDIKTKREKLLYIIKNKLTQRERKIVIFRYGLGFIKPITQREVAKKMGISRSYVSRLEKSALEKIKFFMTQSEKKV